jgi:hypothetical protein
LFSSPCLSVFDICKSCVSFQAIMDKIQQQCDCQSGLLPQRPKASLFSHSKLPKLGSILEKFSSDVKSIATLLALSRCRLRSNAPSQTHSDKLREIESLKQALHLSIKSLLSQKEGAAFQAYLRNPKMKVVSPNCLCLRPPSAKDPKQTLLGVTTIEESVQCFFENYCRGRKRNVTLFESATRACESKENGEYVPPLKKRHVLSQTHQPSVGDNLNPATMATMSDLLCIRTPKKSNFVSYRTPKKERESERRPFQRIDHYAKMRGRTITTTAISSSMTSVSNDNISSEFGLNRIVPSPSSVSPARSQVTLSDTLFLSLSNVPIQHSQLFLSSLVSSSPSMQSQSSPQSMSKPTDQSVSSKEQTTECTPRESRGQWDAHSNSTEIQAAASLLSFSQSVHSHKPKTSSRLCSSHSLRQKLIFAPPENSNSSLLAATANTTTKAIAMKTDPSRCASAQNL